MKTCLNVQKQENRPILQSSLVTLPSNVSILSHPSSKINLQNHAISPQPLLCRDSCSIVYC